MAVRIFDKTAETVMRDTSLDRVTRGGPSVTWLDLATPDRSELLELQRGTRS